MQKPVGTVIDIVRDERGERAVLAVDRQAVCARCASGKGCGAGIVGGRDAQLEARFDQRLELETGDEVTISLAPRNLLKAATIVYGIPLIGAAVAAGIAYSLGVSDAQATVLALTGLLGSLLVSKKILSGCIEDLVPVVTGSAR